MDKLTASQNINTITKTQFSYCLQRTNQEESPNNGTPIDKGTNINLKKSIYQGAVQREDDLTTANREAPVTDDSKGEKLVGSNSSIKKGKIRFIEAFGVRVSPSVVRFNNTFENQTYTETVAVQNVSDSCVMVRIRNARAWSFRLTPLERGYLLAPGLKISRHIHYTCTKNGVFHSTLPIYVNENLIDLPLEANKGQVFVDISPTSLQFGRVDIGCKPVDRKILIKNVSLCATKFLVDLGNNDLGLQVSPIKGWIRPNSKVTLTVRILVLRVGIHSTEFWISTDLCQTRIYVEVEACRRNFIVHHPNTISEFTLVDFPATFYGCRRYQTLVVRNMAASISTFVVLVVNGNKGEEPFEEAKTQKNVKMFDIEPTVGKIRPFEQRIFTFWFCPILIQENESIKKMSDTKTPLKDFICTIKIKRIQVDDTGSKLNKNSNALIDNAVTFSENSQQKNSYDMEDEVVEGKEPSSIPLLDEVSVLLYLYGEAEIPSLKVIPDALYFPNSLIGTTVNKVVQLTNNTNQTLAYKYKKIPFFEVFPDFKKLVSNTSYDIQVKFSARNIGDCKELLTFEVLAEENATDNENLHVVDHVTVKLFGNVKSSKVVIQPKFNLGITPMITNEGQIEKTRGVMTVAAKVNCLWHKTDARTSFLTLHPRPTDVTDKTIYKVLPKNITPIDKSQTFTSGKLFLKKANDDQFLKYLRGTAAISVSKKCCCKWGNMKVDSDPHYELDQVKDEKLPREFFVPLTIVQLYRIKVHPSLISFGSVTTSKTCYQPLSISNENDFKVSAKLVPLTSGINVQMLDHFIISEESETTVMLTFERARLGRYSGTITCIINGFHSFDIAVIAEVVHRSLTINPSYVEIKIPDIPFADMCVPVSINNPLNIPINFTWVIPAESPIKIEPINGVAPKLGTIWCGVFFEPDSPNYKLHPLKLMVEGTSSIKLLTGVMLPRTNVYFLESVLNIGNIPMNLTTIKRFMVFNPDFSDAMFVILNKEPMKGVKIIPTSGSIKAKSCMSFSMHLSVSTDKTLDFVVYMTLQNTTTIELKVTGSVVYPEVEVTPKYINLHRVPCNSVTRTNVILENKSRAKAEVSFDMDEYPQFKISLSKRHHDPALPSCGVTLEQGASLKLYLHFIPKDLASYEFFLPISINGLQIFRNSSCKELEAQGENLKSMVRSSIIEGKTQLSKQSKTVHMSHIVLVNVVVLKASLVFSDLSLSFSSTSETKNFTIKNTSEQPITILAHCEDNIDFFVFCIEEEKHEKDRSSIFKITVLPGESISYTVIFQATSPGLHVSDVAIHVSFQDHDSVYNTVRLTGHIPLPCVISSSVKEIYFQPVPLNTEISCVFNLEVSHNVKNKETVIRHGLTKSFMNIFTVEYPKGSSVVGITTCTIPVKITFKSSYPTSLRKQIIFKGDHTEESVLVIATANNCLLTTHAFLKAHSTHQTMLKTDEEAMRKVSEEEKELNKSISKHQIFKPPVLPSIDNSSGESSLQSSLSMKTISSIGNIFKEDKVRSIATNEKHLIRPSNMGKEVILISNSDMGLSLELNNNEEVLFSRKPSMFLTEIIKIDNEKLGFPMFPLEPINDKALYMLKTLKSVEQWVYEQVFCCSYNPTFGSHSFSSFIIANKKDYSPSSPVALKNVFDVLERICGRRIRRFFTPVDKIPEDAAGKVLFNYGLYRQLLDFMEAQGALMAHVEPKYLMVYEEYCIHHKFTFNRSNLLSDNGSNLLSNDAVDSDPMSFDKFQSISVQCWLDLFLQIFKIFVLLPAVGVTNDVRSEGSKHVTIKLNDSGAKKLGFGHAEEILLSWLNHQYNTHRTAVWPEKSPPPRTVTNFDTDLEDGLVLTVTTAAYCPYLSKIYFHGMCLNPSSISQAYHNSTCLCLAWGCIKLGFSITPRDFVHSNMIQMFLLVTHLYQVLPSYKPESTIVFKAILNENESQIVSLQNNEEVSITYHVEILPNSSNFFLDNCPDTFVLKRKSTSQITVRYLARNTNKAEAILLVCGACMPPKFGRNYVFKLEGFPVKLPVSSSFNIVAPQNIAVDTHITIASPHKLDLKGDESLSYNLWISYAEPQPGNLNAHSFVNERKRKMPRRIFFESNTLIVTAGKGKSNTGILSFKVCCYSQIVRVFWLIFRNPEVGDFIVKLQVTPRRPEPVVCLQVMMNRNTSCACESEVRFGCSRSATVKVPCRNTEQWGAIRMMFELTLSPEEKVFWAKYIETNIGFRLLQWMLEEKKDERKGLLTDELEILFEKSKTYNVTCASKYVTCAPTLHIPDVRGESFIPFQLHLNRNTSSHSTILTMTSTDGFEIRCFNLKIVIRDIDSTEEIKLK